MTNQELTIRFKEYTALTELSRQQQALCHEAEKAMVNSHSPYSKFRVGAALRLQSGTIIHGSNQENVAYPSGLCAERVALFYWGANHPHDPIEAMAVTAATEAFELQQPITSCGSCLQVLAEYEKIQNKPVEMILFLSNGPAWVMSGVEIFLPFLFFENRLNQEVGVNAHGSNPG